MSDLSPERQIMLNAWQQHTYAEFVLRDADAALATMTDDPYVILIPAGTGGSGRDGVYEFYSKHFLPGIPADMEVVPISQIFADDRIIEETVFRFTHSAQIDWMIPGLPATGKKVEFVMVGIIQLKDGKVANEHLYWDQATILSQLGVIDHPTAAAGTVSAQKLLKLSGL